MIAEKRKLVFSFLFYLDGTRAPRHMKTAVSGMLLV